MPEKYIATAQFEDEISFFDFGSTPDLALAEFMSSGQFEEHSACVDADDGTEIEIRIYTWKHGEDCDEDEGGLDQWGEPWGFVLDKHVETHFRVIERETA